MRLGSTRLNAESHAKMLSAPLVSTATMTRSPQLMRTDGGFGPAIRPSHGAGSWAMVLIAVAAVIFISTIVIEQALTAGMLSPWKRSSATSPTENNRFATPADSKSGVLRLPPLEPEQWRSASSSRYSPLTAVPDLSQRTVVPSQSNEQWHDRAPATVPARGGSVAELAEGSADSGTGKPAPSLLIAFGNDYLARKDVAAARLFYRRAADGGSAGGAAALAASYDPVYLNQHALHGVRPDPKEALRWYYVAAEMGDLSAASRVTALMDWLRSAASGGDNNARALLERASR